MQDAVLVGDVGGTNVRFALATRRDGALRIERFEVYAGKDYETFDAVLHDYLGQTGIRCSTACLAMAGPVKGQTGRLTNRAWEISAPSLMRDFQFSAVLLINDFTAMARSVPEMEPSAFETIVPGKASVGSPIIVAGPGTGFGVATLSQSPGGQWSVISGEGGHMAFAPRTEIETKLATILRRDHGYVSNELVASGGGLEAVHKAFSELFGVAHVPLSPAEIRKQADAGNEICRSLIEVRALAVMGAAGDLALANGALGGVVLAGGVTERLADFLKTSEARERFSSRGPMSYYLQECPVRLLHDPVAPLIGAAAHFEQHA